MICINYFYVVILLRSSFFNFQLINVFDSTDNKFEQKKKRKSLRHGHYGSLYEGGGCENPAMRTVPWAIKSNYLYLDMRSAISGCRNKQQSAALPSMSVHGLVLLSFSAFSLYILHIHNVHFRNISSTSVRMYYFAKQFVPTPPGTLLS